MWLSYNVLVNAILVIYLEFSLFTESKIFKVTHLPFNQLSPFAMPVGEVN